jgi:hypothetical protein
MVLSTKQVVCLLPEKELFDLATSQLISDMEIICRELGFSVEFSKSLFEAFSKVLFGKYKLYIVPYPAARGIFITC